MRIVHYYSQLLRQQSGVTMSLAAWARAQQESGHQITLLSAPPGPERGEDLTGLEVHAVDHRGSSRRSYVPIGLGRHLRGADLMVLHEGWVASNAAAAFASVRAGVPYVVVPHGVYEPGVMAGLKARRVLRQSIERVVLEAAAGVHVFFPSEIDLVRRIAPRADCFTVPTGTFGTTGHWEGGGGYIAWFGRYAPQHKGLDRLLDAWAALGPTHCPPLRMHGTDYQGGLDELRTRVSRLNLQDRVSIGGPVYGVEKEDFLRRAAAYVHPSAWECHSVALVEALERGIPSIVSDTIHIAPTLADAGAAVVTPVTPGALEAALQRVQAESSALSSHAMDFVQCALNWDVVIKSWDEALRERLDG